PTLSDHAPHVPLLTVADVHDHWPSMPVVTYAVSFMLSVFKTAERKQVELNVASTLLLDVTLEVAGVEAAVSVTAVTPIVPTEVAVGTIVSQRELENLPLNGRQFANLPVLAPGTALGYNADPTKPGPLTGAR